MTDTLNPTLTSPLTLRSGQTLPNRIMKSALSEGLADSAGSPDGRLSSLYSRWADGGYGLIVTGNVMVDERHLGEPGNVVVTDDRDLAALTRWAKTAQDGGSPIWMQLNHPGRQANPIASSDRVVAPSAVRMAIPGMPTPRALTDAEVNETITRFATSAAVAQDAGFDGVQIHAAHGYLVSQFLSPLTNVREDRWGGSIENRTRFLLEIIRAIRAAVRPSFSLGVKLNSADFQRGGFTEEDSRAVISMIAAEQLDLIEISGGSYESPAMMGRPAVSENTRAREAYFLDYATTVRELADGIPLAVTGGFRSRSAMAEAIAAGACDVIGIGRPAAITPEAAREINGGRARLDSPAVSLPVPTSVRRSLPSVKTIEGALDLQWHTDQLHRMGGDLEPDPTRQWWRTAASTVSRNGFGALRSKRGTVGDVQAKARRKFRVERAVGRYVANPTVALLSRLGVTTTFATHLQTVGRKSGLQRSVPVSASFDDDGAWVISQHGLRSGWALNLQADPVVRIRQGDRWRTGTAAIVVDDDVVARARTFAPNPALAALTAATFRAMQSDPVSVRITFTDA